MLCRRRYRRGQNIQVRCNNFTSYNITSIFIELKIETTQIQWHNHTTINAQAHVDIYSAFNSIGTNLKDQLTYKWE